MAAQNRIIAILDPNRDRAHALAEGFNAEFYRASLFTTVFPDAQTLTRLRADALLIAMDGPQFNGTTMMKSIHARAHFPVIMLAGENTTEADIANALRAGADDVVRKGVSFRILRERVVSLLNRYDRAGIAPISAPAAAPKATQQKTLTQGDLFMDPERFYCTWKEKPVRLTSSEFSVLAALAQVPNTTKSRDVLLDTLKDSGETLLRSLDTHIKRLRAKFRKADNGTDLIETLYGEGYRFNPRPRAKPGRAKNLSV